MERPVYRFWLDFENMLVTNFSNMAARADSELDGSLQGALGYWAGYGVAGEKCLKLELPKEE